MTSVAAAVTLLRLPLARLSSHLRSFPCSPVPPPRFRLSASHRALSSLFAPGHGLAVAAVSEAVAVADEEELEAAEEQEDAAPPSFVLPRLPRPKLDVKERKELASYAHGLGKKLKSQQVGKGGVTPSLVGAFSDNLESNELLKLKIHGNCPGELPDVILQLEESTGSIAVDQIGRSVILYRPSSSKMKKREEVARNREEFARNNARFGKSEYAFGGRPRNSTSKRFGKSGSTFRTQQPSSSKMKKREEVARNREEFARNNARFGKSEYAFGGRPRNSTSKRFGKSGSTFRTQQKRRSVASKGSSYGQA